MSVSQSPSRMTFSAWSISERERRSYRTLQWLSTAMTRSAAVASSSSTVRGRNTTSEYVTYVEPTDCSGASAREAPGPVVSQSGL